MNYALYYPSIEFQNYEWLWSASLLWDRIYRIVPEGYEPDEPDNVRALTEAGEIGIPIRPDAYVRPLAEEFLLKVESGRWDAAALVFDVPEAYATLHQDKVDVQLRDMLISKGKAEAHGEWLHVPTDFEALYMTYLAERISRDNDLQMLSNSPAAWSGATYFKYDGNVRDFPNEKLTHQLASLIVRDFIPEDVLQISPDSLIKFRDKYKGERQRFVTAIREAAKEISNFTDEVVYKDRIEDLRENIEKALADYRASLRDLRISGWTGIKTITFPVLTQIAVCVAGHDLSPKTLSVISGIGIGVGLVSGLSSMREKEALLKRSCDYSYLLQLEREWKGCALYGNDYNYRLCRTMEEFIND